MARMSVEKAMEHERRSMSRACRLETWRRFRVGGMDVLVVFYSCRYRELREREYRMATFVDGTFNAGSIVRPQDWRP